MLCVAAAKVIFSFHWKPSDCGIKNNDLKKKQKTKNTDFMKKREEIFYPYQTKQFYGLTLRQEGKITATKCHVFKLHGVTLRVGLKRSC